MSAILETVETTNAISALGLEFPDLFPLEFHIQYELGHPCDASLASPTLSVLQKTFPKLFSNEFRALRQNSQKGIGQ